MKKHTSSGSSGIGERIVLLIRQRGISQQILAERTGLSAAAMANIVNNRRMPGIGVVERISRAMGVSCHWLITGDPEPPSAEPLPAGTIRGVRPPRVRRRSEVVALIHKYRESQRARYESWRKETMDAIVLLWRALSDDPHALHAADAILSFLSRHHLSMRRVSRFRFRVPGSSVLLPDRKYEGFPSSEQLMALLPKLSAVKLQLFKDFLDDLYAQSVPGRTAVQDAASADKRPTAPELQNKIDSVAALARSLFITLGLPVPDLGPKSGEEGKHV